MQPWISLSSDNRVNTFGLFCIGCQKVSYGIVHTITFPIHSCLILSTFLLHVFNAIICPLQRNKQATDTPPSHLVSSTQTYCYRQMTSDADTPRRVIDCLPLLDRDGQEVERLPLSECTYVAFTKACFDTLGTRDYGRLARWIVTSDIVHFTLDGIDLATPILDVWFWDTVMECPSIRRITIANTTIADGREHYYNMHQIFATINLEMLSFVDCDIRRADIGELIQWRLLDDEDETCDEPLHHLSFRRCIFDHLKPDDLIAFACHIGDAKLSSVNFEGCYISDAQSYLFQGVIRCKCPDTTVIVIMDE